MKPNDVRSNTYIDSSKEINDKNPKFKTGDIVRISKCKNVFLAKDYTPNWSKEIFVIKKVKNAVPWTSQKKIKIEKVIKKKGNKIYAKWKVYDN